MKRTLRRLLIFFGLILIGAVTFFPYNQYAGDLKTALEREARSRGVVLEIEQLSFGFPLRLGATGIAALLPQGRFKIPLWINSVDIVPEIWPIFSRKVRAGLSGKAYEGDLSGRLDWSASNDSGSVSLNGSGLKLELYPAFQLIGARGTGSFNFSSDLNMLTGDSPGAVLLQPVGAKLDLTVEDGGVPSARSFGPLLTIPAVSDFNLQAKLEQAEQTIKIRTFKIDSSLGKLDADGTLHLTGLGRFDSGRITAAIDLTEAGVAAFGPQLAMFSGVQRQGPVYSWSAAVDLKAGGFPNIKILPH